MHCGRPKPSFITFECYVKRGVFGSLAAVSKITQGILTECQVVIRITTKTGTPSICRCLASCIWNYSRSTWIGYPLQACITENGVSTESALGSHREISHSTRLAFWATIFLGIETNICNGKRSSLDYVYLTIHCSGKSAPLKATMTRCREI